MRVEDLCKINSKKISSLKDDMGFFVAYSFMTCFKEIFEKGVEVSAWTKRGKISQIQYFEVCKLAKITRTPSTSVRYKFDEQFKLLHTDVMGPIAPSTFEFGTKYIISFIDNFTWYAWSYPMVSKLEVHTALKKVIKTIKVIGGQNAKITRLTELYQKF